MPTVNQSKVYNFARKNELWEHLTDADAAVLLQDAEDYIRSVYPIRSNLSLEQGRMFDALVYNLAATFQKEPPSAAAVAAIKSVSEELGSMKTATEYFQGGNDPYPRITALVRPFLVRAASTGGVRISRMRP